MANKSLELALRVVAEATGKQNLTELVNELREIEKGADTANPAAGELANQLDKLTDQSELINAFQKSKKELDENELAVLAAAKALESLQREARETDKPFTQLARSIDAAEKDLANMRQELSANTTKHNQLQQKLKQSGLDTRNLAAEKRRLAGDYNKTGKAVDTYTRQLQKGNAAQRAHGQNLSSLTSQIVALSAAYVSLNQVASAVQSVFSTGDKFERLGVQMNGLMGSISAGEEATQWIADFTKNTPLQLGEVSQAFVKLKAFGLDPMDGSMQSIVDSALKLGGAYQEVEGISLALGQAWAKQKLQGEEILQLVERGVPVWDLLQQATGKNVQELQKLSSAGELGRDSIKALINEMGKDSVGSAQAQMALLSGQISNGKDNLEQFYNLVSKSGAMDWLKTQISEVNKEFAAMAADGRLQQWAQKFSDTIVATGEAIKSTVTTLYDYREEIIAVAKAYLALKVGSYFTDVTRGAIDAIAAFNNYKKAIVSTEAVTKAATIAANNFKTAITWAGRASLYGWLILELGDVYTEYKKLVDLQHQVKQSEIAAKNTANALAMEYKGLGEALGYTIRNQADLDALLQQGLVVYNEVTGHYQTFAKSMRDIGTAVNETEQAERKRQELMQLTLPEAVRAIETLQLQAKSLDGVRVGVDGFIATIDAAKLTLQGAGEEYSQQIVLLESLREKFEAHNASLERQAYLNGDLSAAYKELGLTASDALLKTEERARGAFEMIVQSQEPLALQRQAFLAWADSAIEAANATDQTVPASVQAAAAALGLTEELQKLVDAANELKPVVDNNSEAVERFQRELDKTNEAIAKNNAVLKSATASAEDKRRATQALIAQEKQAQQQSESIAKVRAYESATMRQLIGEQDVLERQLEQLNQRYAAGVISADAYNQEKDRMQSLLRVVNDLLGDYANAQSIATRETKQATAADKESIDVLNKRAGAMNKAASATNSAANAMVNYNKQSGLNVNQNGNRTFTTFDPNAGKEQEQYNSLRNTQYQSFKSDIEAAKGSVEALNDVYNRLNKLNYLSKEQKNELKALVRQFKDEARSVEQSSRRGNSNKSQGGSSSKSGSNNGGGGTKNDESINKSQSFNQFTSQASKVVKLELVLPSGKVGVAFTNETNWIAELEALKATT